MDFVESKGDREALAFWKVCHGSLRRKLDAAL